MQQMVMGIMLLIGLWLLVLANLWGQIDVVLSRHGDRKSRLLGMAIGASTVALLFALAVVLTPLLKVKIAKSASKIPNSY